VVVESKYFKMMRFDGTADPSLDLADSTVEVGSNKFGIIGDLTNGDNGAGAVIEVPDLSNAQV